MTKVGVREISRATGYSPATVSNALNGKRGVSEETVRIILDAAEEMGIQQDADSETITFVLARKTGQIVDESTFHPAVIEGVERQARRHGMGTTFLTLDFSDAASVRPEVDALMDDPTSAVVLLGTELDEEDYELFASRSAHLVVLDSWSDRFDFDAVVMSNGESSWRAVRHLIECGHREIGYLAGSFRIQNFKERERGYVRACTEAGIELNPAWRVELGTTLERAYRDMAAWLTVTPVEKLPTAFFADNDVLAVGALRAFSEAGVRVPQDVSVIGFDDLSVSAFSNPPLTTIHVLKHEVGELAVRRLMGNIVNPKKFTCKTQVSTYFVERKSVCRR